jgi:hypothetical protein
MSAALHIAGGDCAGELLAASGIGGEVFVWHDILYDGPRNPGWPDDDTLRARARFLEETTAGGLDRDGILATLANQYRKLASVADHERIVLWFDACLFDQAMLAHIVSCLPLGAVRKTELLCVDRFPGIEPFHGLAQLSPSELASLYGERRPVTDAQIRFAEGVDRAFATQDAALLAELSCLADAPLPWIPAAVRRWLKERPDPATGLGLLEQLALSAIRGGCRTPNEIFAAVAAADTPPQYWGDITLWAKLNALAKRTPPLARIEGPAPRLPQWRSALDLNRVTISPCLP